MSTVHGSRINSIRWLLIVPFAIQLLAWVSLVGFLSLRTGQDAVGELINRLGTEIFEEVQVQLDSYMGIPLLINEINHNNITSGLVDIKDVSQRNRYFAGQLLAFPRASYSYVGYENREFYGARRNEEGQVELIKNDAQTGGASWYYAMGENRDALDLMVEIPNFDCRTRPWYKAAKEAGHALYSPVYRHFVYKDLSVTAAKPLYDSQGTFIGVLGVDFRLDSINEFLNDIKTAELATIVVVERSTGEMIGNSLLEPNHGSDDAGAMVRRLPSDLSDGEFVSVYNAYIAGLPSAGVMEGNRFVDGPLGRVFFQSKTFRLANLDWEVLVAIPEREFMAGISRNAMATVFIIIGALFLSIILAVVVAQRIVRPLQNLVLAAETFEAGNLQLRVNPQGNNEVTVVSKAFNTMAERLEGSFKTMEDTIAQRTEELRDKNFALARANQTKDKFFSIVAHDLKGPMGTISIILDDLAKEHSMFNPGDYKRLFNEMASSSHQVYELLENLLTWAKSQKGDLVVKLLDFPIHEALVESMALLKETASQKGIVIDTEVCSCMVHADRDMVKTIHRNLISNAIKFSPAQGIIETGVQDVGDMVEVWVKDHGVGMDEVTLAGLFLPGGYESQAGTQGEKGSGLGLLICKEFVEKNGGTMGVTSAPGMGTTMTFTLPKSHT